MADPDLEKLAERCEAARGADWEIERDIQLAIAADAGCKRCIGLSPGYTRSIAAALTLVPEGHGWSLGTAGEKAWAGVYAYEGDVETVIEAATPALALCAAALRARIQQGNG